MAALRQATLLEAAESAGGRDGPGGEGRPLAATAPLASRMRPRTLDEYCGQRHLVGPGMPLRAAIERDDIPSMILWGPPGVGKTTLANVVANATKAEFVPFSAVTSGIKEIKAIMARAEEARRLGCAAVTLNVWEGNDAARRFYEKMGMTPRSATMELSL